MESSRFVRCCRSLLDVLSAQGAAGGCDEAVGAGAPDDERRAGGGGTERSPDVVQLRPNTRQNGGAGSTRNQHETTRFTTPSNLQNLHPRFKSGRRLQISSANSIVCALAAPASG